MRIKLRIKLLFALMSVGLLIGCSAEADTGDSEIIPEGVKNGTVSQDFYNEIVRLYEDGEEFDIKQEEIIAMADPYYEKSKDIAFRKDASQHTEDYTTFLDTFEFSPSNDAENELTAKINEYIAAKKEEIEFIGVTLSLGSSSSSAFGLLLKFQETAKMSEFEVEKLLKKYKLGYEY